MNHIIDKSITFGQVSKISKRIGSPSTNTSCLYLFSKRKKRRKTKMKKRDMKTEAKLISTDVKTIRNDWHPRCDIKNGCIINFASRDRVIIERSGSCRDC